MQNVAGSEGAKVGEGRLAAVSLLACGLVPGQVHARASSRLPDVVLSMVVEGLRNPALAGEFAGSLPWAYSQPFFLKIV